ncbi:MAG: beta-lactamase family protein [Candidatus Omnitrophica bacterium]|nr:beta-lactamase family protein [Candidatus Omnitrophota bacterium]
MSPRFQAPLSVLDEILEDAVARGDTAGVEGWVEIRGEVVFRSAFGFAAKVPKAEPLRPGTVFDLASVTKAVATTTAVLILVDRGLVRLDGPVWSYLKPFGCRGKERITVRQLLTHASGLPNYRPWFKELRGKEAFQEALFDTDLENPPGATRIYSDLGYMTLGWLVEAVSGLSLDRFVEREICRPLGLRHTRFDPPRAWRKRTAATEDCPFRGRVIRGEVHDENAWSQGGVAGHAGLFSTLEDLAKFARAFLNAGKPGAGWPLTRALSQEMVTQQPVHGEIRQALGWWLRRSDFDATVFLPSDRSFGHTGFTGCSLWIDPENQALVILLANAIHPNRDKANPSGFRKPFHEAVCRLISRQGMTAGK